MGRQCQVLISPCLSLLLLQCLWFIRGMMAGQGRGQVWRFGRGRKRGRAGDWFVIAVLALWFTVSACSPFNSGHRKSNTIHISGCHVRFISSYVSWVFLYRKRKGKAAVVMPCLKRWGRKREVGGWGGVGWGWMLPQATWGHWRHKESPLPFSLVLCQEVWLPLAASLRRSPPPQVWII